MYIMHVLIYLSLWEGVCKTTWKPGEHISSPPHTLRTGLSVNLEHIIRFQLDLLSMPSDHPASATNPTAQSLCRASHR